MFSKKDIEHFLRAMRDAIRSNHRRIVVLTGNDGSALVEGASELVKAYMERYGTSDKELLYVFHAFYEDSVERRNEFRERVGREYEFEYVPYHECRRVLGLTYDVIVMDLINNLEPNDLGRLLGIARGGGFYIFLMARLEDYDRIVTRFQRTLLTPQYKIEDIRHIFPKRIIKKLFERDGIAIYDVERRKYLKKFKIRRKGYRRVEYRGRPVEIPERARFPRVAYELALTQDQVEVLKLLEELYERPEEGRKVAIVITADRGRGKSSVVGIGLAALAHKLRKAKGRTRILVTAPSEHNVQPLFMLAVKTLRALGHDVQVGELDGSVVSLRAKGIEIEYASPLDSVRRRADIVAVDEAAGLQVPMLFTIKERFDRIVFSSTIHGYEGAGRGFSVRFLGRLRRDPRVRVLEYEMDQPIRYSEDDPVERWAFDALLLDAEPAELDRGDLEAVERMEVEYYKPSLEEFFLESDEELRQFIGIYVMAHYRNNPNDLGIMMDAPHHTVRALRLPSGKIVVSLELAEEGPLAGEIGKEAAKGAWIAGNIVPDRLIKHYKLLDFGELVGWRVVRIATHPAVMRRGLGSRMLEEAEKEARERGYDWIGAGFGVTEELLKFWLKNGFTPVHMSPDRNPVSGEYSVIVVKPLNERASECVEFVAREFKRKLLDSLYEPYFDLEARIAHLLLKATPPVEGARPKLTLSQIGRFMSYAWREMTLENCMDCMRELTKAYFMDPGGLGLSEEAELMLVAKVLQGKSWKAACDELDVEPPKMMAEMKEIARAFSRYYFGVGSEGEAERYMYLRLERAGEGLPDSG